MTKQKARRETQKFILACDEFLSARDAEYVRAAVMFYIFDGWEEYWPFPRMPKWLQPRYWDADVVARVKEAQAVLGDEKYDG